MPGDVPALKVTGLSKTFPVTKALDSLSLELEAGGVTALLGENGSGKSTLVKILAGVQPPDPGGAIGAWGRDLGGSLTPAAARDAGLRFVHQDVGLLPEMTVADNVALGSAYLSGPMARVRPRAERARTVELLGAFGLAIDPDALAGSLSPLERTMVAVARAMASTRRGARRIVVLDEPTATLPAEEVGVLFDAIRAACADGAAVLLVTHRLPEVMALADRIAVLRDGRLVADRQLGGLGTDDLVTLMLGKELERVSAPEGERVPTRRSDLAVAVKGLSGKRLAEVDLDIYGGEILGLAGLVGSGRSELMRILAGVQGRVDGLLEVAGEPVQMRSPRDAIARGIVLVPQERRRDGCILAMKLRENLTLGNLDDVAGFGTVRRRAERRLATDMIERFGIRPPAPEQPMSLFSGGNQQKAVIARSVQRDPTVLLLDEPTQGIDIGARTEIAAILRDLRRRGTAIVLASSDDDELLELADRVAVFSRGRLVRELQGTNLTREELARATKGAEVTI
ncbi:MAG TPA: sugar ABC transporter ATP-binding protein [Solirubrobacterales bacterium]